MSEREERRGENRREKEKKERKRRPEGKGNKMKALCSRSK